jgi:hypothetical protein
MPADRHDVGNAQIKLNYINMLTDFRKYLRGHEMAALSGQTNRQMLPYDNPRTNGAAKPHHPNFHFHLAQSAMLTQSGFFGASEA